MVGPTWSRSMKREECSQTSSSPRRTRRDRRRTPEAECRASGSHHFRDPYPPIAPSRSIDALWCSRVHVASAISCVRTLQFQCQPPCRRDNDKVCDQTPRRRTKPQWSRTPTGEMSDLRGGGPMAQRRIGSGLRWNAFALRSIEVLSTWSYVTVLSSR